MGDVKGVGQNSTKENEKAIRVSEASHRIIEDNLRFLEGLASLLVFCCSTNDRGNSIEMFLGGLYPVVVEAEIKANKVREILNLL